LNKAPLIIGHRGASAVAPENTLLAFKRAIHDGADGIEFDVRLARDNVPVVIHDSSLKRTASINKSVSDVTSEDLKCVDVGAWFKNRSEARSEGDETVPTLRAVFDLYKSAPGLLYLEMKGEPVGEQLPSEVVRLIQEYNFTDRVVVESFDLSSIARIKQIAPGIRTAALFDGRLRHRIHRGGNKTLIARAQEVHADELALHHSLVTQKLIMQATQKMFDVVVWTVDKPRWADLAHKLGIKAVITNNPALMLNARDVARD
jgi:glycerophosphoryl diester phosphodiesterase